MWTRRPPACPRLTRRLTRTDTAIKSGRPTTRTRHQLWRAHHSTRRRSGQPRTSPQEWNPPLQTEVSNGTLGRRNSRGGWYRAGVLHGEKKHGGADLAGKCARHGCIERLEPNQHYQHRRRHADNLRRTTRATTATIDLTIDCANCTGQHVGWATANNASAEHWC